MNPFKELEDKIAAARRAQNPSVRELLRLLSKAISAHQQGNTELSDYYKNIALKEY